jgi:Tat protein secretion system quality control protein TatD with DNase activity
MAALLDIILEGQQRGKVVAVGEMGLDYDRCLPVLVFQSSALLCRWEARATLSMRRPHTELHHVSMRRV